MNQRFKQIYHWNKNVKLMEENVIKIKSEIPMNVDVNVKIRKNIICPKNIIFEILLHVIAKKVNIKQVLMMI